MVGSEGIEGVAHLVAALDLVGFYEGFEEGSYGQGWTGAGVVVGGGV